MPLSVLRHCGRFVPLSLRQCPHHGLGSSVFLTFAVCRRSWRQRIEQLLWHLHQVGPPDPGFDPRLLHMALWRGIWLSCRRNTTDASSPSHSRGANLTSFVRIVPAVAAGEIQASKVADASLPHYSPMCGSESALCGTPLTLDTNAACTGATPKL